MHFHLDHTIALAGFAAAPLDVKTESSRFVAPGAGFHGAGEELAHRRKNARIGRWI